MDKTTLKLLGCAVAGAAGAGCAMFGVKLIHDGAEDLELAYYDPNSDKLDMYEASVNATKKFIGGIALGGIGGSLIGASIGTAFNLGQAEGLNAIDAPVMISANTLEEAQKNLDLMKGLAKEV